MEVRLRRVSQYLYHVESYSDRWGWIDLTEPGCPVPYVEARRMQLDAQGRSTRKPEPWMLLGLDWAKDTNAQNAERLFRSVMDGTATPEETKKARQLADIVKDAEETGLPF